MKSGDYIDVLHKAIEDKDLEDMTVVRCIKLDEHLLKSGMEDNNIENYTRSLRYYLSKIMMELKPEDVVLDVGGGDDGIASKLKNIVKTIYVNDINVKKIYNSNCIVLENNVFDLNISDYKINKVFLGHAFEHFWGESDIKFIEKVGNELPIGGKCCIEPLFIGQKYIEVIREGFLHDKQDDNPIRIITKTSMFPGKVEENMGFARIYDIQSFERRIKQIAKKCGLKITIYSFKSNDKYLPDMIKYKFKRKEINYPYRMLILEKEK